MRTPALVLLLFCAAVACGQQPPAATATQEPARKPDLKLAEGAYGGFNSWELWAESEKQLRAEIEMQIYSDLARAKGQKIQQRETLRMEPNFTMTGFRYESKNFSALPDGALECTVNPESLDCVSTFPGKTGGKGKINAAGGYATQFGVEIALLDIPWFFDTLVAESDRDRKQPRTFGIVTIAFDGDTPDTLVTGSAADANVNYVGPESIKILGRLVKSHKFQVEAHTYRATVWTADSGLLLAADWGGMRIELTRLRQWIELVPELPVEKGGLDAAETKPKQ